MRSFLLTTPLLLALSISTWGQNLAKPKLNQPTTGDGVSVLSPDLEAARIAFNNRSFIEAERRAQLALQADPNSLLALVVLARSVEAQVKDQDSPENQAVALRAIKLYENVLVRSPNNLEAFRAMRALYDLTWLPQMAAQWGVRIAENAGFPVGERIQAYGLLAYHQSLCAGGVPESSSEPRVGIDVQTRMDCAKRGLKYAVAAENLGDDSGSWTRLGMFLELAELSKTAGRTLDARHYSKQAADARKQVDRILAKYRGMAPKLTSIDEARIITIAPSHCHTRTILRRRWQHMPEGKSISRLLSTIPVSLPPQP